MISCGRQLLSGESGESVQKDDRDAVTIIIPCFNESKRLDLEAFRQLSQYECVKLLFVDDGSTDETLSVLNRLQGLTDSVDVLQLYRNVGKGEAVRRGFINAIDSGAKIVGYLDADLATPASEMIRLLEVLRTDLSIEVVIGSRIKCLGSNIHRHPIRHMVGRVYATGAAVSLGIGVYDTQCGAKLFVVSPILTSACSMPFGSKWAFDVRLLSRLLNGTGELTGLSEDQFLEVPLKSWSDVPGSKVGIIGGLMALVELIPVWVARFNSERHSDRIRGYNSTVAIL